MEMLLVEDDVYCVDFFRRALKKNDQPVVVHHASSAEEAKDFLATMENLKNICLIVLDIKLPQVSGLEFLRYVKQTAATSTIPVVMFTSSAERQDIDLSYQLGANSYLIKPVDFNDFSKAVHQLKNYWISMNRL